MTEDEKKEMVSMIRNLESEIERLRAVDPKSENTHMTLLSLLHNYTKLKDLYFKRTKEKKLPSYHVKSVYHKLQ